MHLYFSYDKITNKIPCIVWTDERSILATDTSLDALFT